MTDVAASDFRHPRRYVRLDTILRLRWLAVLGQLATIFIVAQGLEFDVEVIPCLTIIGLSALLNLALQIAFNPMQRLEPAYAAALLALNIIELAGLLYRMISPRCLLRLRSASLRWFAHQCWSTSIYHCHGTATSP